MKIINMTPIHTGYSKLSYPYPYKATFDNGNSRIIHDDKDCYLLEQLLVKQNES